jgi:hypothetical protein
MMPRSVDISIDEFFADAHLSRKIFKKVEKMTDSLEGVSRRASRSQIVFRRRPDFAWAWIPGRYLKGKTAPLVLSVSLPDRDKSSRWKEIVQPSAGRFLHHLELHKPSDVDQTVKQWLYDAWEAAE